MNQFVSTPCERITYSEAILYQNSGQKFEKPVQWGLDLQSEHERYLAETHIGGVMAVTDYPKEIKAFYMRQNDDDKTVAAVDILVPGVGEMVGGSQREERLDRLDHRLNELKMCPEEQWWYRDLRRYGTVPHAGFGLGFERAMMYLTGIDNIRDVIPFPRTPRNADLSQVNLILLGSAFLTSKRNLMRLVGCVFSLLSSTPLAMPLSHDQEPDFQKCCSIASASASRSVCLAVLALRVTFG